MFYVHDVTRYHDCLRQRIIAPDRARHGALLICPPIAVRTGYFISSNPTPVPVVIVTGQRDEFREATIVSLRAKVPAGTLLVLTGSDETLEGDLVAAAASEADCTVIDLATIDTVGAVLDTLEPLIDNGEFALLGIITMLDAGSFWAEFSGGAEEVRGLVAEIEAASLVILAGDAPVADDASARVEGFVRNLNPTAAVIPAEALRVQTLSSLGDLIAAADHDAATEADPDDEAIAGETDAWGYNSFTWTTASVLDRVAFLELFEEWPSEILRAHGVVRMEDGGIVMVSAIRDLVTLDEYDELDEDDVQELGAEESELAFVGIDLPVSELVARLDACQIDNA